MDIFFYIDHHIVGNFKDSPAANPDGSIVYDYNVMLYANASISQPGSHNFTLRNGQTHGSSSLILFDYIIYTSDVADQTSSNTPALAETPAFTGHTISKHTRTIIIASAIVGGVFTIILLAIIFVLYRSRADAQRKLLEVKPWVPMPAPPAPEAQADQETPGHVPLVTGPQQKQFRGSGALETHDGQDAREDYSGVSEALNPSDSPSSASTSSLQPERVQDNFASAENFSDITPSEGPPPYSSRHTSSTRS
ncbi:hypothetical protein PHLCEN_2v386 [Hermanssonia centrifuga]|uniref:Uncharacterized protein n=1 Tax=Hermanssonia centrifuga TaxID=98765 RepID=A0A2R6S6A3_9APHY|nr:hypothetical protein PHLCEN_2v386 [Hermanssonia centrifuga]